jgi:hypothetical protein
MRLINAHTLKLEHFIGVTIPTYAILSHTWGEEEVTYQDWFQRESVSKKAGYAKILGACRQALKDSIDYVWVDTNCIDKTSSTELSEEINSMFRWYKDSARCYVYMADVSIPTINDDAISRSNIESNDVFTSFKHVEDSFCASRWFTRGWTLQELLASTNLIFFSDCWKHLGDKRDLEVLKCISRIIGINDRYLSSPEAVWSASISERMSWMANRVTTRVEDTAYCMMGIFEINMPLLYGEGNKAVIRLQEHIISVSNDQTIFCWSFRNDFPNPWNSVLAPHPSAFRHSAGYIKLESTPSTSSYFITNGGISVNLRKTSIGSSLHLVALYV